MRDFLRRRSASRDSESGDAFGITRSLVNAATALRSSALLFAIFCVVGIAVSATYVLFLQKVIAADPEILLRATILTVLWMSAICVIFLLRIAREQDDIGRLQDRYFSIGLRTVFEFGDPPGGKIAPDVVDRLLSVDPLLRKEVDTGRAEIQYDVDMKAGGLTFPFDAVISGRRRLVLVQSYADQGRRIEEADIAKLSEEIRSVIATARPRRADILAVWQNDLTEQAVGFSQDDEKWRSPAKCSVLRTMIFVSRKGYQIASAPSEAITKEDEKKVTEAPAIAYAPLQRGRARKRAALSSIAMASILILAVLAIFSISISESNLPDGPGGGGQGNLKAHDPIFILGNAGIINTSGVLSGIGTADDPFIIEGWSITSNSTAIEISDTTAHIVIRNLTIESPGINNSNGISIHNSRNCQINNVSVDSRGAAGIWLDNSAQISIVDSRIKNGSCGIYLRQCSEISIGNCDVQTNESSYIGGGVLNGPGGIGVDESSAVSIMNTTITNSVDVGATVRFSNDVSIVNLTCGLTQIQVCHYISIADSIIRGMIFFWDTNVTVSGNNASGVSDLLLGSNPYGSSEVPTDYVNNGISFWRSDGISILNNIASFNYGDGIAVANSTNVDVRGNNASSNGLNGINLTSCEYVTIDWNQLYDNSQYGVRIDSGFSSNMVSSNTFIGNNGAGNTYDSNHAQASDDGTGNWWNSADGSGNYWSDWTTPDANYDGIVDLPYNVSGSAGSKDYYPLAAP